MHEERPTIFRLFGYGDFVGFPQDVCGYMMGMGIEIQSHGSGFYFLYNVFVYDLRNKSKCST